MGDFDPQSTSTHAPHENIKNLLFCNHTVIILGKKLKSTGLHKYRPGENIMITHISLARLQTPFATLASYNSITLHKQCYFADPK